MNNQIFRADIINVPETFANAILQELDTGLIDLGNIWFPNEAEFPLASFVNKNWRILETENPLLAVPHYSTIVYKRLIGRFFRLQTTISTPLYLDLLCRYVAVGKALKNPGRTSRFIKDLPSSTKTSDAYLLLKKYSEDLVIALDYLKHMQRKDIYWPPYSHDFSHRDFVYGGRVLN